MSAGQGVGYRAFMAFLFLLVPLALGFGALSISAQKFFVADRKQVSFIPDYRMIVLKDRSFLEITGQTDGGIPFCLSYYSNPPAKVYVKNWSYRMGRFSWQAFNAMPTHLLANPGATFHNTALYRITRTTTEPVFIHYRVITLRHTSQKASCGYLGGIAIEDVATPLDVFTDLLGLPRTPIQIVSARGDRNPKSQVRQQTAAAPSRVPTTVPSPIPQSTPPTSNEFIKLTDLTKDQVTKLQYILKAEGFSVGKIDGIAGPRTVAAFKSFQRSRGLPATGVLSRREMQAICRNKKFNCKPDMR